MHKPAPTDLPILDVIRNRWSPVGIGGDALTEDQIVALFEAARWSQSSYNEQPWSFIYATKENGDKREALESLLAEGNSWAKNAPLLILAVAKKNFAKNDKPNRHYAHDTGAALNNIFLQATDMGLAAHEMAGFDVEKARKDCGIPDSHEPITMMAVGHFVEPASEDLKKRDAAPRNRKEREEFVFYGEWKAT